MNWAEFFYMDGRGFYVWGSYGAFAVAIMVEIVLVRLRGKRAQAEIEAEIEEQPMASRVKGGVR